MTLHFNSNITSFMERIFKKLLFFKLKYINKEKGCFTDNIKEE